MILRGSGSVVHPSQDPKAQGQQHWLQTNSRTGNSLEKGVQNRTTMWSQEGCTQAWSDLSGDDRCQRRGPGLWFEKSSWTMQDEKIDAWLKGHLSHHPLHLN
jgi:hypothetical protein